jgi:hypothetical protein
MSYLSIYYVCQRMDLSVLKYISAQSIISNYSLTVTRGRDGKSPATSELAGSLS